MTKNISWTKISAWVLFLCLFVWVAAEILGIFSMEGNIVGLSPSVARIISLDLRLLCQNGLYSASIFFIGAKIIDSKTLISVGFDRADLEKFCTKGPDENNVVWIGRSFIDNMEAKAFASALNERLERD